MHNNAKWIWQNKNINADEYVYFYDSFTGNSNIILNISCDSNYMVYINYELAAFGQYADYPHYKIYDKIDVSHFCSSGSNNITIAVWYYGVESSTYCVSTPGLIYSIESFGELLCQSDENVKCQLSPDYLNYKKKYITSQLGLSYQYNFCGQRDAMTPNVDSLNCAVVVKKSKQLYIRPNKKLKMSHSIYGTLIKQKSDDNTKTLLFDLNKETAGFLHIKFKAKRASKIIVAYGEHIADGFVRQKIGTRDFSVELYSNGELCEFLGAFLRLGCRYLQVTGPYSLIVEYVGIAETYYPVNFIKFDAKNALRQKIYDTCVRTLHLCMHEHYEDTPWREQAMYTMDSRNQMLCGYYAFNEFNFSKASLLLMSKGQRKDGILSLCFPDGNKMTIPFYSLIFINSVYEYALHSKDYEFALSLLPMLEKIANVFISRIDETGLIKEFTGFWNFYEWSEGLDGMKDNKFRLNADDTRYSLLLNAFIIYGVTALDSLYSLFGKKPCYESLCASLRKKVYDTFYDKETGIFTSFDNEKHFSKLSNALAILTGCAFSKEREVCQQIINKSILSETTLSMKAFEYDALLKVDHQYSEYILKEIDKTYSFMLDNDATSFWETVNGEKDFSNAGSLCHGWSAMPVYYYHKLIK